MSKEIIKTCNCGKVFKFNEGEVYKLCHPNCFKQYDANSEFCARRCKYKLECLGQREVKEEEEEQEIVLPPTAEVIARRYNVNKSYSDSKKRALLE